MQNHFTNSIFYHIELTAKYCKILGQQIFEKYNAGITMDEYEALDTLMINPEICQRDLAKMILKDRANTGKLLDNLEKKGFIVRKLAIKNNRPVKIAQITEAGARRTEEITEKIRPHINILKEKINEQDLSKVRELLEHFRTVLKEAVELQI